MLNSARADLISIDQTTALRCASVLTRARYCSIYIGVNEVSVSLHAAYHGFRMTNCDLINIRNIITSKGTIPWIREIKRSPDTMKVVAILVSIRSTNTLLCL